MNDITKATEQVKEAAAKADSKWNSAASWVGSNPKKSIVLAVAALVGVFYLFIAL